MSPLQLILIVLIVLVIAGIGFAFIVNKEAERKKRLQGVIAGRSGPRDKPASIKDDQDKRRAEIAKKLKETKGGEEGDGKKKKKATIGTMIAQAGLEISTAQFWLFSVLAMVLLIGLAQILQQSPLVTLLAAITGFFGVPRLVLKRMASRRQKKFLEEFPDALDATVRLLKAGMPVSKAVLMISREFSGPVGEEMSRIYDKQKIGIPLYEAAYEATRRMPLAEMKMFATGLAIQAQTGSSLSEVLSNLSGVIRARFRLKRKIKALSSEAVVSAGIIGALPNLVAVGMYFANREYIMVLFETTQGNILLAIAVVWMSFGIIAMKIMINFKV